MIQSCHTQAINPGLNGFRVPNKMCMGSLFNEFHDDIDSPLFSGFNLLCSIFNNLHDNMSKFIIFLMASSYDVSAVLLLDDVSGGISTDKGNPQKQQYKISVPDCEDGRKS